MKAPILILGATSSIAKASANRFASQGHPLYLAGRNERELERICSDISIRWNVPVVSGYFDACDFDGHARFFEQVLIEMPDIRGVLIALGYQAQSSQTADEFKFNALQIDTNFKGICSILAPIASHLAKKRNGWIMAISSVAGDRGRQSNYAYGSTKAALDCYLSGLRQQLFKFNVRVITIKPGFVDTPMTYGKKGLFLVASPERVAKSIVNAVNNSKDVVYVPGFWRYILWILCSIPEFIFKRLKL